MKNGEQGKSQSTKTGGVRVFFAVWPDAEVQSALYTLAKRQQQACDGRVMAADTLHLTLLFLGSVPVGRLQDLFRAASDVRASTISLALNRFAGWRRNAIGYAAPAKMPAALSLLDAQLRECIGAAGFEFDDQPLHPHVTLLRNMARIPHAREISIPEWRAKDFVLVKSLTDHCGARYEIIGRWQLACPKPPSVRSV